MTGAHRLSFERLRIGAILWLCAVVMMSAYLGLRFYQGVAFRTDLLALLPQEEQNPVLHQAIDRITQQTSRRIVFLVGHRDQDVARAAVAGIESDLESAQLADFKMLDSLTSGSAALGTFYFPYRQNLLSKNDRDLLQQNRGAEILQRALAQIFSVGSFTDSRLLQADPFLLLPAFLTSLPVPSSNLALDHGRLSVLRDGMHWVLSSGQLLDDPFALAVQERLTGIVDTRIAAQQAAHPDTKILRTGAVFFARAGSQTAMTETSTLGTLSSIGTILLLILVFRHVTPLLLNVLAVVVGIGASLAGSILAFGEIHIITLLFGVGLIGVAVDYGLHYMVSLVDRDAGTPTERLRHVLPGITLGLLTTLIGYIILVLAPFPGLRQIAVFSVIGLCAAFLTVIFWFPMLDRRKAMRQGDGLARLGQLWWAVWENPRYRLPRYLGIAFICLIIIAGFFRLETNDDVRRMQSLDPDLMAEQAAIQELTGASGSLQNLLILATDDEAALREGEALADLLTRLHLEGVIGAFRGPASFIPSQQRQEENRQLLETRLLAPYEAQLRAQLGMKPAAVTVAPDLALTPDLARESGTMPFLDEMILAPGRHVIALDGVTDVTRLRAELAAFPDVVYVDPAGDFSALLAKYRARAIWLVALSAGLMLVPLCWRYGFKGAVILMAPPTMAVLLAPSLLVLGGGTISFFNMMALVLVLSIGVDYAIFCAEAVEHKRPGTQLAVILATLTTLLSFGLLAFSQVVAVHAFGLTLLLGVLIAFLLAPMVVGVEPRIKPQKNGA
ncbi:MMPL family transporter [Dongia sp.]|uniref:MMPL family transporter n=1 Tax=Dongia sp. TaxID=1977262 RepID=UPI0035AEBD88